MAAEHIDALILNGGKSRRLGRKKADFLIRTKPKTTLLQHTISCLQTHTKRIFISQKNTAKLELKAKDLPQTLIAGCIQDKYKFASPLNGILSALQNQDLKSHLLVVACDFPLIGSETLNTLCQNSNKNGTIARYFQSAENLPEPLCAIYEKKFAKYSQKFIAQKITCPRKILLELQKNPETRALLEPIKNAKAARELFNMNEPKDAKIARKILNFEENKQLNVLIFGKLSDDFQFHQKKLRTKARDPLELLGEIMQSTALPNSPKKLITELGLKVALNTHFCHWQTPLQDDDEIAFLPPSAGG